MSFFELAKFGIAVAILCGIFFALAALGDRPTKRDRGWHGW